MNTICATDTSHFGTWMLLSQNYWRQKCWNSFLWIVFEYCQDISRLYQRVVILVLECYWVRITGHKSVEMNFFHLCPSMSKIFWGYVDSLNCESLSVIIINQNDKKWTNSDRKHLAWNICRLKAFQLSCIVLNGG